MFFVSIPRRWWCSLYPEKTGPLTGLDDIKVVSSYHPRVRSTVPFMAKKVLKIVPEEITRCMS